MNHLRRSFLKLCWRAAAAFVLLPLIPSYLPGKTPLGPEREKLERFASQGLKFLVIGDWGRRGEPGQMQVARQMAIEASQVGAQFVISVGDNFYEKGVSSTDDPQWKTSFRDVYCAPSLTAIPWFCILGNHDYQGNPQAQVDYSARDPRWRMPARYYTHAATVVPGVGAEFFFIDTTPFVTPYHSFFADQSTKQQIQWLKQALAKSRAAWKIVVGHHPIYSGGEHGPTLELRRQVRPLLQQHGVQAYFNGHDHDLQHLRSGPVHYFDSGAGSQARETTRTPKTVFAASVLGFMSVAIEADSMTVKIIDSKGTVLHTANVARNNAAIAFTSARLPL